MKTENFPVPTPVKIEAEIERLKRSFRKKFITPTEYVATYRRLLSQHKITQK